MLRHNLFHAALVLSFLLTACSEPAKVEKTEAEKTPKPLTGRQAFQRVYPQARVWSPDAQPLHMRSIDLSQVKPEKGKAGAWEVIFVSPSKGKSKSYTFSSVEAEGNLHEGVFAGPEESYSGPNGPSFPFSIAALKIDSNQAYDIASEKSADYIKKHPGMPISFVLEQTNRFPDLTWRVIWGQSAAASDYSVFVDATLGKYLQKAH